jgi:uncharacterized protein
MIPLRLVLDTNIVVSAALKPAGLERTAFLLSITKPAHLYISDAILAEYRDVLLRPQLPLSRGLRRQFLDLVAARSKLVSPMRPVLVATDPSDNKFLECAEAARADYLITGNLRHFPQFWKNTKIITSRQFLNVVAPHLLG